MPSSAELILKDYEILFKNSKETSGFLSIFFKNPKIAFFAICPFCKIEMIDEKTRRPHRDICWKLHVIITAKYEVMSIISQSKVSESSIERSSVSSYCKMLSKLDRMLESEASKWELKYSKSLNNSLNINLNDFEFIKPITKGGYGQIFLMKDKSSGKLMCAKIISISEAIQRSCLKSYVSERNSLLRCDSNQIISLYYSFRTEFFLYQVKYHVLFNFVRRCLFVDYGIHGKWRHKRAFGIIRELL